VDLPDPLAKSDGALEDLSRHIPDRPLAGVICRATAAPGMEMEIASASVRRVRIEGVGIRRS